MQIQISWLLQKPTDLDLHYLQRYGISRFSRTDSGKHNRNANVWGHKRVNVLWGLDTLGRFPAIFTREITFVTSMFAFQHTNHLERGLLGKERICSPWEQILSFSPHGSKFFPFWVDPFSEGNKTIQTEFSPLKVYTFTLKRIDTVSGVATLAKLFLPSKKGSTLKGKKLLRLWVYSYLLSRLLFRRACCAGKQTGSNKSCLPCKNS